MMDLLKKHKIIIITAVIITAVLVVAFIFGGNGSAPKPSQTAERQATEAATVQSVTQKPTQAQPDTAPSAKTDNASETTKPASTQPSVTQPPTVEPTKQVSETKAPNQPSASQSSQSSKPSERSSVVSKPSAPQSSKSSQSSYKTDPVPKDKPKPVEPQEQTTSPQTKRVTISVSCETLLNKLDSFDEEVRDVVPPDGQILTPQTYEIKAGESVFDVLKAVCTEKKIHLEFTFTPIYNSAYIEGIGNLYEFDCGSGSGWMYKVDGWFPNYGSSRYVLKGGENIAFVYTTDLGKDVGGDYRGQYEEEQ